MAPRGHDVAGLDPMTEPACVVGKPDKRPHRMTRRIAADPLGDALAVDLERHGRSRKIARAPLGRTRTEAEAAVAADIRELRQSRRRLPSLEPRLDQLDRRMDRADGG